MARVGSAYSEYRLDLRPFNADVAYIQQRMRALQSELAALRTQAQGGAAGGGGRGSSAPAGQTNAVLALQRAQAALEAQQGRTAVAADRLRNALAQQSTTTTQTIAVEQQLLRIEQQAASQSLQLAQARARSRSAAGDYASAERILSAELAQQARITPQVVAAQSQLEYIQRRAAGSVGGLRGSLDSLRGSLRGVTTAFGALGVAIGVQQLVSFGAEAIRAANSLEKTQSTVRALAGSQQRYIEVLNIARQGQQNYGGSLEENLRGLGSLVNLSNRAGVSLTDLDNVARRLAIIDPLQGIEGANIALKELLTGSDATAVQSLVRRFELPKSALRELTDESLSAADRLKALDQILNQQGITNEVLTNRVGTTAATFDRAGAATERVKIALGALLAQGLEPQARGWERLGNAIAGGLEQLATYEAKLTQVGNRVLIESQNYDDYAAKLEQVNSQLPIWGEKLSQLTPAQYEFARSLMQTGTSADEAAAKARGLGDIAGLLATQISAVGGASSLTGQTLSAASGKLLEWASYGEDAKNQAFALASALAANEISGRQFWTVLDANIAALQGQATASANAAAMEQYRKGEQQAGTGATQDASAAAQEHAAALLEQLQKTQESALASQELERAQALLANIGAAVASGQITAAQGAYQFGNAAIWAKDQALALVQAQALLAQGKINTQAISDYRAGERSGGAFRTQKEEQAAADARARAARRADQAAEAEARYQQLLGNTAPLLARYRSELAGTTKGSKEYYEALSRIQGLEERGAKGRKAGGAGRISAQQKTLNQLEDQEIKFQQKMEDAAQKHEAKLVEIERKAQEKRLAAQRTFQLQQRTDRADFYASLADIEDAGLRQTLSARYEQDAEEAGRIRDQYGADVAADYEQLQRQIIEEEVKLQDQIGKLRSDRDEEGNKKSREEREADLAEAEYLEGVLRLKQDANQEKLRQLLEDGSAIERERTQAINEEQQRYAEAQASIIESSDRATDTVLLNAQRRKVAIDQENASLAKTSAYYDRLGGGGAATATPPSPATAAPAQGAPPVVAATPEGGFWLVRDDAVVNTLSTTNSILTGGFDRVVAGLEHVARRVQAVESAVRNIQSAVR